MSARPRLYFSFRSPYSWLAVRRLREAVPDLFTRLDLQPYWDPDERSTAALAARGGEFHYVQMSRAKHLYMLLDTKRLAQRQNLTMAWPIDRDPWWELPHLAWLAARREGLAEAFYDALAQARWGRGEDICQPVTVRRAAKEAGFAPETAVLAAESASIREEGVDCLYRAYLDDIFGIPYLKLGRHRFWGLERVDAFLEMWQAGDDRPVVTESARLTPPYDLDTPGGCG
ncbi:2-hydroxychromene-2-carboxylate isomerase [Micromonospora sp. NPDC050795]|uniref:2-hydroxychromene-2-carboxylate isomerase n=1 Tax=Micromonospora sp. NPDC050795 TaxID=3364282 RepID=UPI0037A5622F